MAAKVAVVTGAGSGIGRAVARALLDRGYAVGLAGRREEPLLETAAGDGDALVLPTDVTSEQSVAALFARVRSEHGRVDLLFNNAGCFGRHGEVDDVPVADWLATIATNLTGSYLCAREAFAAMKAQAPSGGRIINNGSISAHSPRPGSAAYTAAKHGVTGLTKSLSLDGRRHGIACGQIDIGNAGTEMTAGIAAGVAQADGSIAPEPTFDPRHVAEAVLMMADLPLDANVQFMTLAATSMPFIGRG